MWRARSSLDPPDRLGCSNIATCPLRINGEHATGAASKRPRRHVGGLGSIIPYYPARAPFCSEQDACNCGRVRPKGLIEQNLNWA